MKIKLVNILLSVGTAIGLYACGSGSGGDNSGTFSDDPVPQGGPYPKSGSYESVPYDNLPQPSSVNGGVLAKSYPDSYLPNGLTNSLQIAYGNNDESRVANISAYVTMGNQLCSATPVYFDANSQTTFLIGAAHCFVSYKNNAQILLSTNMVSLGQTSIKYGVYGSNPTQTYEVKAVYLRKDYCYGSTFTGSENDPECPNFSPSSGANTQGNDIAIIQVNGKYGNPDSYPYPEVVPANEYPTPYTMAPVLSIGYGINTQTPTTSDSGGRSVMYYVAGYQYWQQDLTNGSNNGGYHYLYNSYYNSNSLGRGYTALICGGDSGGGDLFWTGSKWILLSEHTYGPRDACGTFYNYLPNGATNVSAYYDWIMTIMNANDPVAKCRESDSNCVTNAV